MSDAKWLDDVLPNVEPDFDNYRDHECAVLTPALIDAGYFPLAAWYTGDGDSFGPLTRCIDTTKGTIIYG